MRKIFDGFKMDYYECECLSPEHTVRWTLSDEPEDDECELYFEILLNDNYSSLSYRFDFIYTIPILGFVFSKIELYVRRFYRAIKYFFGYKSRYGDFDCFSLREEDVERMISMLKEFKSKKEYYKKRINIKNKNGRI